jgi:hypothetical protein
MSRLGKLKRQIIEEANKLILKEDKNDLNCECYDGIIRFECCEKIELHHSDEERLHHLLNSHPEKHTFMDSIEHNLHAHFDGDHLKIEIPHLGPHHNIEFDLEGTYPTSHDNHDTHLNDVFPHIVIGGGFKIPIISYKSKNKHS